MSREPFWLFRSPTGTLRDLVGATRQVITLHLRDLERDGAIIRESRRLILVPDRISGKGAIDPPKEVFMPRPPAGTAKGGSDGSLA